MARHRFGDGRYRYFAHPLPEPIEAARVAFYEHLAPIANRWADLLSGDNPTFPATHRELLERCREAGQERPTPLMLRYREGDWNALHQDLYGDVYFPFQVLTRALGRRARLRRRRVRADGAASARAESRARPAARAGRVRDLPDARAAEQGRDGYHRIGLRHGVSTVTAGTRTALGVIFHDAR